MLEHSTAPEPRASGFDAITVSLVGDVLLHRPILDQKTSDGQYDFAKNMAAIAPSIQRSSIAVANQECITAGEEYGLIGFKKFNSPVQLLDALKTTGFDVLNVANNHMTDKGEQALLASMKHAEDRGFLITGAAETPKKLTESAVMEADGVRVGFVSFADGSKIGKPDQEKVKINSFPGENARTSMYRRIVRVQNQVDEMRKRADVVILQLHFGEEYNRIPSAFQLEFAASLAETDVDAIVCHHPHVLQPVEWVENSKGRHVLVAYSLGNFFSGQQGLYRQIGGILSFTIETQETPNGKLHQITHPTVELTYVDVEEGYTLKPLHQVIRARSELPSEPGATLWRNSTEIYNRVRRLVTSMDSTVTVY